MVRKTGVLKSRALTLLLAALVLFLPVLSAHALAQAGGIVAVSVIAADVRGPLAEVPVRLLDMETAEQVGETVTSEDGKAAFEDVPFGLYQVSVVAPEGYADAAGPLALLREDRTVATVEIVLSPAEQQSPSAPRVGGVPLWLTLAIVAAAAVAAIVVLDRVGEDITP